MAANVHRLRANPGKKLTIVAGGIKFARFPIRTKVIMSSDKIADVVRDFAHPHLKKDDVLVISERAVAITQGRMIPITKIKPGMWAKLLVRFVYKPSWGIGIGSPWTMQVAIDEAGLWRILFAGIIGTVGKLFGVRGLFYRIVGSRVNAIDGPTSYTLPPGNESATLGPKNPDAVANALAKEFSVGVAIIDANDIGQRIEGASVGVDQKLIEKIFSDNPLGQAREQTPMAIVRKI